MPTTRTPELSILVPTYARPERIESLLEALGQQTLAPERFEVIVVDDGSPEPIQLDPARYRFHLTALRQENAGPAAARNLGLAQVSGPLTLILNDDAVPCARLCEEHLAAHAERSDKVAVLGSFHFTEAAKAHPFVQVLEGSELLFDFVGLRDGELHDWTFFWTCNLSIQTEALRAVEGFDAENFDRAIVEDVELGYRLERCGYRVLYRESASCWHDHEIDIAAYMARLAELGKYKLRMCSKHADPTLLNQSADSLIDEDYFGRIRARYEEGYASFVECVELVQSVERRSYGTTLEPEVLAKLRAVTRGAAETPLSLGVLRELSGFDPEPIMQAGATPGVLTSVIVVAHQALDQTRRCLERLRKASKLEYPMQLLFVDNGSTDGTADYLAQQPDVTLIRNSSNLGAPRARNQALPLAKGQAIAFLDNDAMVESEWLERLLFHLEVDPFCACVGPLSDRAAHGAQVEFPLEATDENIARFAAQTAQSAHREYSHASLQASFCLLVRAEIVELIGGFDERFSPWGYEDDDFTLRALLMGYTNRLAKDVFVRHEPYAGPKAKRHEGLLSSNWRLFAEKWGLDAADESGRDSRIVSVFDRHWAPESLRCPLEQSRALEPVGPA